MKGLLQADDAVPKRIQQKVCGKLSVLSENRHTLLHGLGSSQPACAILDLIKLKCLYERKYM